MRSQNLILLRLASPSSAPLASRPSGRGDVSGFEVGRGGHVVRGESHPVRAGSSGRYDGRRSGRTGRRSGAWRCCAGENSLRYKRSGWTLEARWPRLNNACYRRLAVWTFPRTAPWCTDDGGCLASSAHGPAGIGRHQRTSSADSLPDKPLQRGRIGPFNRLGDDHPCWNRAGPCRAGGDADPCRAGDP